MQILTVFSRHAIVRKLVKDSGLAAYSIYTKEGVYDMASRNIASWIIDFADDVETGNCDKMVLRNNGTNIYADEESILLNFESHMSDFLYIDFDRHTKGD